MCLENFPADLLSPSPARVEKFLLSPSQSKVEQLRMHNDSEYPSIPYPPPPPPRSQSKGGQGTTTTTYGGMKSICYNVALLPLPYTPQPYSEALHLQPSRILQDVLKCSQDFQSKPTAYRLFMLKQRQHPRIDA